MLHYSNALPAAKLLLAVGMLPPWLDPALQTPALFSLGAVVAFSLAVMGGEWMSDGLSTLLLALRVESLFVGLVVTTLMGALPLLLLIALFAHGGHAQLAMGAVVGGASLPVVLPLALAATVVSVGLRERWVSVDLPLLIVYFILFLFFCLGGGINSMETLGLGILGVGYLVFRYIHGKDTRYGLAAFGRNFIFGASIGSLLGKVAVGLLALAAGSFYLYLATLTAVARWQLPELAVGATLTLPFCIGEVAFAFAAIRKGQGEVILGRSLGLGILVALLGGSLLGVFPQPIDSNAVNFFHLAAVALLLLLWLFARTSSRFWEWQGRLLVLLTILVLSVVWAQGYDLLAWLRLPRELIF